MHKKAVSFIFFALFTLFTGCDLFMQPVSDFIKNATGSATGDEYTITTNHFIRSADIAIPVNEDSIMHITLDNPQNYNLALKIEGEGSEKAAVELSEDRQAAIVTITAPERLEVFDLTMTMTANGRPMPSYKLPVMEGRFFNADIDSITVLPLYGPWRNSPQPVNVATDNLAFKLANNLPGGTLEIDLLVNLVNGVFSSYTIKNNELKVVNNTTETIEIIVTADSGVSATYYLTLIIDDAHNVQTPTITDQPQSGNYLINDNAELYVNAVVYDGGTLTYQWYSNTTNSTTGGTPIAGATGAAYQPSTTETGNFYYYCVITNEIEDNLDGGLKVISVVSDVAAVTIDQLLSYGNIEYYWLNEQDIIATTTGGNEINLLIGETLTITANGEGYTNQQWFINGAEDYSQANSTTYYFNSEGREPKRYTISLIVQKGGRYYNAVFSVVVIEEP